MYHIGQFRSTQSNSYAQGLRIESMGFLPTTAMTSNQITFENVCGNLSGTNQLNNQNCYYLRFSVKKLDSDQTFYLKICNVRTDGTSRIVENEQLIKEYKVGQATSSEQEKVYFETIIAPNDTYNLILWELQRTADDYLVGRRKMSVTVESYTRLIDMVSTQLKNKYAGLTHLTKIGIQGPPSLLMCINGEQIRIGRTGIYEINNGMDITSISFVPKTTSNNTLDYFIMDFEY